MDFLNPISCISWIIVGAIAGGLARRFAGDKDQPFINDLVLGLIGAAIGGFIISFLRIDRPENGLTGALASLVVATIGAVLLLGIRRMIGGRK